MATVLAPPEFCQVNGCARPTHCGPCSRCRMPSMLPGDTRSLDKILRGNEPRGGINVVSFANWSYRPGRRRS
jgi:hypothetical protein